MDKLQIHCPGCGVRLDVPAQAGGRPARCPKCKTRFRVPDPHVMLDDTVTCWLNLDQIHEQEEREEVEELLQNQFDQKEKAADEPAPQDIGGNDSSAATTIDAVPSAVGKEPSHGSSAAVYSQTGDQPTKHADRVVRRVVQRQAHAQNHAGGGGEQQAGKAGDSQEQTPRGKFVPIDSDADQVKLHILGVGAYGVRLGFACRWLNNAAFRASMPMRGMVSGETDASKLIARPLAWVDKATGHFTNPGELEARYELHVKTHQLPREVVELMRPMDELPTPFNLPMPYYVGREDTAQGALHCETVATPRGIQCEVVIPAIRYAMEWLGRVNGVCGPDYQQLENEALKFEAGSWRTIPQQVRHRLAVWFEFQGDEQFLAYLGDSDFAKSDLGLAGIIVTTQRIVWCKYHHHGAAALNEAGLLTAVERRPFADLQYRAVDGTKRKMVRLRCEDVDALADLLSRLEMAMTMQIETAAMDEGASAADSDSGVISISSPESKSQ